MSDTIRSKTPARPIRGCQGYTLVELMIVVLLMGILAAVVIPEFNDYPDFTRRATLSSDLKILRTGIECYYLQHSGIYPGNLSSTSSWDLFVTQLTESTDRSGNPGTRYGPYLRGEIPRNPYNLLNTGKVGAFGASPDGTSGWAYDPDSGEIRPNHLGAPWGAVQELLIQDVEKGAVEMVGG